MAKLTEWIDWMEPPEVSKEFQAVIDETNRQIRECFSGSPKVMASLRSDTRAALAQEKEGGRHG